VAIGSGWRGDGEDGERAWAEVMIGVEWGVVHLGIGEVLGIGWMERHKLLFLP
jgi:hypothetical protein